MISAMNIDIVGIGLDSFIDGPQVKGGLKTDACYVWKLTATSITVYILFGYPKLVISMPILSIPHPKCR